MIKISKKEALNCLKTVEDFFPQDPMYFDKNLSKALEGLKLFITQELIDKKPLDVEEKEYINNVINSAIDRYMKAFTDDYAKCYKKLHKNPKYEEDIRIDRILLNFFAFCQAKAIDEFINFLECNDFFKGDQQ